MQVFPEDEARAFVGPKADYYLREWSRLPASLTGPAQFNWSAFWLSGLWLGYRKMYKAAAILIGAVLISVLLEEVLFVVVLGMSEPPRAVGYLVSLVVAVACGNFGNRWYFGQASKTIRKVHRTHEGVEARRAQLAKRGGTSVWGSLLVLLMFIVGALLIVILLGGWGPDVDLLRQHAEQGDADSQYNLGIAYYVGEGVPENDALAVEWFRLAAEQGHAQAQFNLAEMYAEGEGVPQDGVEAVKWLRLAAEQGEARAQHNLGIMYSLGTGVPQDYVQAHKWCSLAAAQGLARLGDCLNLDERMTADQIAEAQRLARHWLAARLEP